MQVLVYDGLFQYLYFNTAVTENSIRHQPVQGPPRKLFSFVGPKENNFKHPLFKEENGIFYQFIQHRGEA